MLVNWREQMVTLIDPPAAWVTLVHPCGRCGAGPLLKPGDSASLRRRFAFFRLNECNRDFSPIEVSAYQLAARSTSGLPTVRPECSATRNNLIQRLPTDSSFGAPGERSARTSRIGGWPKKRLYSRLNCVALSYPTSKAALAASRPLFSIKFRAD
jgi:hypothetical protein